MEVRGASGRHVAASARARPSEAEMRRVSRALVGLDCLHRAAAAAPAGEDADLGVEVADLALRDEVDESRRHVEVMFGAIACPGGTAWFVQALAGKEPQLRATAVELAEATLGRHRWAAAVAVLDPTLDDTTRRQALEASGLGGAALPDDPLAWLADVATDADHTWHSAWLRASVLRALPGLSPPIARNAAAVLTGDADPVVAETAAWGAGGGS